MKDFGRISVCGCISAYNDKTPSMAPVCEPAVVSKQLKMEGFLVGRWMSRWMEGLSQMTKWIQEVKKAHNFV
jgi:prostaglandin reductase 1